MQDELFEEIVQYLNEEDMEEQDENSLNVCIDRAIRLYKSKRNYPSSFSEDAIEKDMEEHHACIFDLALFFFFKMGAEYQTTHIENTIHRGYQSENMIFIIHGVFPYAKMF